MRGIRAGDFVRLRNGEVAGPLVWCDRLELPRASWPGGYWDADGRYNGSHEHPMDVVQVGTIQEIAQTYGEVL